MRHAPAVLVFAVLACLAAPARAHDARPLSVNIAEQSPGLYTATIKMPPTVTADNRPELSWPAACSVLDKKLGSSVDGTTETMVVRCKNGLEGENLQISYAIYNPSLATLFRLEESSGTVITRVLPPDQLVWIVPKEPGWREVAAGYLRLGVEHIWGGVDHLLFVTGLLILAGTFRRILLAITGFTVAHSITLSLSVFGLVRLPVPPVEAAIALSILFLAREIAHPHPNGIAERFPILVSSSFGLLHGFGFAAALQEVGLPTKELAVGLLCFNLGVEIGQVVFIVGVLAVVFAVRKALTFSRLPTAPVPYRMSTLAGYALGIPAAFWFVERLAAF
jgi:hydrogenase/urease accessory protein HupE